MRPCSSSKGTNSAWTKIAIFHSENIQTKFENTAALFVFVSFANVYLFHFSRLFGFLSDCVSVWVRLSICECCIHVPNTYIRVCVCVCADMKRSTGEKKELLEKYLSTTCAFPMLSSMSGLLCMIHVQCAIHCYVYGSENIGEMYESMGAVYSACMISLLLLLFLFLSFSFILPVRCEYAVACVLIVYVCWFHSRSSNLHEKCTALNRLDVSVIFSSIFFTLFFWIYLLFIILNWIFDFN